MNKKLVIVAAIAAALIAFFIWRRRAGAATLSPSASIPPSPQAALAVLNATPPRTLAQEAIAYGVSQALPVVGAGLNSLIPQNGPKPPPPPCPAGYVGYHPDDPSTYCAGQATGKTASTWAGIAKAAAAKNYNPSAGYYG